MENNTALIAGVNSSHTYLMLVFPFTHNDTHTLGMNKRNIELTEVSSEHTYGHIWTRGSKHTSKNKCPNIRHAWSPLIELAFTLSIICWHRPQPSLSTSLVASLLSTCFKPLICSVTSSTPYSQSLYAPSPNFAFLCFAWNTKVTSKLCKKSEWN